MNYNRQIEETLISIKADKIRIDIYNTFGKRRTRAIDISKLTDLIARCTRIELNFENCRFAAFHQSRERLREINAYVKQGDYTVSIVKKVSYKV